jgi:hypothetical protein
MTCKPAKPAMREIAGHARADPIEDEDDDENEDDLLLTATPHYGLAN